MSKSIQQYCLPCDKVHGPTCPKTGITRVYRCDKLKHGIFCVKDMDHEGACKQAYEHINNGSDDRSMYGPE